MDKTTETFASYAANLAYEDLTPKAIHATKRCIVDALGCAFGAFDAAPIKAVRAMASKVSSTQPATLIGTRIKSSPELAGFVNGSMIRYLDFSDDYFGTSGKQSGPHPSDNIGSILAAAESVGADGKALIMGTALAYETCNQLVDGTLLHPNGWDYTIMHSVGTSLGAGKILGLSREQLGNALSLAVVANVSLWQTRLGELSVWKGMAGPNGSRNGLFAALLAKENITGPGEPFEGKAGFMKQLGSPFDLNHLGRKDLPFKIERTCYKYLPVMYSIQLPIWTALELRKQVDIDDIEAITVYLYAYTLSTDAYSPERWDPKTRESADHSGPYLIGAALVDGAITEETMTPHRFRDPGILSVVKKIEVKEDKQYSAAYPQALNCRFEARLKSGKVVSVHQANPKGHVANPLSDQELEGKFLKQACPLLGEKPARALLERLWNLETLDDVSKLLPLMVVPTGA